MQSSSDNKIATILLLIALGFLIYHLTNPNKKRKFVQSEAKSPKSGAKSPRSFTGRNKESFDYFPLNVDNKQENNTIDHFEGVREDNFDNFDNNNDNFDNNNDNNIDNFDTVPYNPSASTQKELPSNTSQPTTQVKQPVQTTQPVQAKQVRTVNNVNAYDNADVSDMNAPIDNAFNRLTSANEVPYMGAGFSNVDSAYGKLLNAGESPDMVNLNKNEVKNYNNKDFLPKEIIPGAFDDYSQSKYNINDDKLINTERYVVGINTVGQSLKNGSHDIRGTIANPKFAVSPWNNSTYEADYNIKSLC